MTRPDHPGLPGMGKGAREVKHGGTLIAVTAVVPGDLIVLAHRPRPVAEVERYTTGAGTERVKLHATGRTFTMSPRDLVERCGNRWEAVG